jgi:transposase-like protein
MPKEQVPGKPTSRRYSPEEKAAAVRMVRALRAELGTEHGTVYRVAQPLGYGIGWSGPGSAKLTSTKVMCRG